MMDELRAKALLVNAGGDTPLDAILRACTMGSWVSYYVALLQSVDPMPVEVLDIFPETHHVEVISLFTGDFDDEE